MSGLEQWPMPPLPTAKYRAAWLGRAAWRAWWRAKETGGPPGGEVDGWMAMSPKMRQCWIAAAAAVNGATEAPPAPARAHGYPQPVGSCEPHGQWDCPLCQAADPALAAAWTAAKAANHTQHNPDGPAGCRRCQMLRELGAGQ